MSRVILTQERYGPVGLVHIDAHSDVQQHASGCKILHGTPFRRAVEESLIDSHRTVQIGIRGSALSMDDIEWTLEQASAALRQRLNSCDETRWAIPRLK